MRRSSREARYAERNLVGVDDVGEEEAIVVWIERRPGAVWAVGRVVNPQLRESDEPRPEDLIFEGYELGDALDRANEALEDDVRVLEEDGRSADTRPFTRKEVLPLLERWFFNRESHRDGCPRADERAVLASGALRIRVGHSPDPDDAFMFWALTTDLVDPRGFAFEQVLADIQTLNQWARAGRLEVT